VLLVKYLIGFQNISTLKGNLFKRGIKLFQSVRKGNTLIFHTNSISILPVGILLISSLISPFPFPIRDFNDFLVNGKNKWKRIQNLKQAFLKNFFKYLIKISK
jgi:hypothetical protein